jgi:hypothetical protein
MSESLALDRVQLVMPEGRERKARAFSGDVLSLVEEPRPRKLR